MKNKLGVIFIVLLVIFIIMVVMVVLNPNEQVKSNKELNETQIVALLKRTTQDLTKSNTLQNYSFTNDSMIRFAFSYMGLIGKYNVSYKDNGSTAIVNKSDIEEVAKYIFDRQVDFGTTSYIIDATKIYIPINLGGDAQIFKYKTKEYDELEDTYKVYIDVLEVGASKYSELEPSNVTKYDTNDVIFTMVFKYKEQDGRRILLAYNVISNW